MAGKSWGKPLTKLRPAIYNDTIGGKDGKDIQRTFEDIKEDLTFLYNSLVYVSDNMLTTYQMFDSQSTYVKKKALKLEQEVDRLITGVTNNYTYSLFDTFNNVDNIDLISSTVDIDVDEGVVTLAKSKNNTYAYAMQNAEVIKESANGKVFSPIANIFNDNTNNVWVASLGTNSYEAIIHLNNINTNTPNIDMHTIDGIYIEIATPLSLKIEWSNDSLNYYPLISENIKTNKTYSFEQIQASYIKLTVSGGDVGIKKLQLLRLGFNNYGSLYTLPLQVSSINPLVKANIITANLKMEMFSPKGTNIKAFIEKAGENNWIAINNSDLILNNTNISNIPIDTNSIVIDDYTAEDAVIKFYRFNGVPAQLVNGSESIVKGSNQVYVEYFNYDWSYHDGSDHIPTPDDYENRVGIVNGFFTPAYSKNIDLVASNTSTLISSGNMLCMQDAKYTDGSTGDKEFLQIGIVDYSGNDLLAEKGNYRFTIYVYAPEEKVYYRKKALVSGPALVGSKVAAPFSIYLNDKYIMSSKYMATAKTTISDDTVLSNRANYKLEKGWNKLQIYIYYPGLSNNTDLDAQGLQEGIYKSAIGFYTNFNPISLDSSIYRAQATLGFQKKVSEFELRQITPVNNNSCWALTTIPSATTASILFNYNPTIGVAASAFDAQNIPVAPALNLQCSTIEGSVIDTVRLRFDFTKDTDVTTTPKLHGYELHIN
jgi:hypothetical protein